MEKYIALLRGINVGGHRKIKMNELKELFHSIGCANITTYIQSGNIVFEVPEDDTDYLASIIEQHIKSSFGHEVAVIIRRPREFEDAFRSFPYKEKEGWKGYISFLTEKPDEEQAIALQQKSSDIEKFKVQNREVFSLIDKQTGQKPRFSNSFVENQLGIPATTRNLRTVRKILELALSNNR